MYYLKIPHQFDLQSRQCRHGHGQFKIARNESATSKVATKSYWTPTYFRRSGKMVEGAGKVGYMTPERAPPPPE
jgi:hypothetical protein